MTLSSSIKKRGGVASPGAFSSNRLGLVFGFFFVFSGWGVFVQGVLCSFYVLFRLLHVHVEQLAILDLLGSSSVG